jgi:hypothetical protein
MAEIGNVVPVTMISLCVLKIHSNAQAASPRVSAVKACVLKIRPL